MLKINNLSPYNINVHIHNIRKCPMENNNFILNRK